MDKEIKEIKINKLSKSITFINNGIAFSQFGIADEILDLITNLQQDLDKANEIIIKDRQFNQGRLLDLAKLKEENEFLKLSNPEMNIEHFRVINENKRKIDNLRKQNKDLQQENHELKSKLECYENGVYYSSKVDELERENERLKEENNNKAMNDYAHAIDESWYRELYDDYKSRCEKASEVIKQFDTDKNFTFPLMPKWEEKQVKASIKLEFKDTYKRPLLNILQNGDDE